jgi:hypothetical protein
MSIFLSRSFANLLKIRSPHFLSIFYRLFCGRRVEACFEVAAWKLPLPRGDYKTTQPDENIVNDMRKKSLPYQ